MNCVPFKVHIVGNNTFILYSFTYHRSERSSHHPGFTPVEANKIEKTDKLYFGQQTEKMSKKETKTSKNFIHPCLLHPSFGGFFPFAWLMGQLI
jgi:hypothetical protein